MLFVTQHVTPKWRPMTDKATKAWLTVSEKKSIGTVWVANLQGKMTASGLTECWQCCCGVTCLKLIILLLVSRNPSQSRWHIWHCTILNSSKAQSLTVSHLTRDLQVTLHSHLSLDISLKIKDNSQGACLKKMVKQTWPMCQADVNCGSRFFLLVSAGCVCRVNCCS